MPSLPPNQQRQSTEGIKKNNTTVYSTTAQMFPQFSLTCTKQNAIITGSKYKLGCAGYLPAKYKYLYKVQWTQWTHMHITMPTAHNASTVSHTDNTRHFTVILPSLTNDTAHFWPLVTRRYSRLVAIADWFQQLLLLHPFNGFFPGI